jgi:hypothetical protein
MKSKGIEQWLFETGKNDTTIDPDNQFAGSIVEF